MSAVDHPGLARIVDVVDDGDRPWVVTELIEDPSLAHLVHRDGPVEPERAAVLGLRLLDVLDAATDQDMVHRFLQPTKVFVGPDDQVRVADFGIASLIGDPTVARSGAVGGVSFMAPEQAGTAEADIWSLGAVLYFAVEGVPPFSGADPDAILEAVTTEPPRPAAAAGSLARVLEVTLQKDPSERPSADELRALLEVAAGDLPARARAGAGGGGRREHHRVGQLRQRPRRRTPRSSSSRAPPTSRRRSSRTPSPSRRRRRARRASAPAGAPASQGGAGPHVLPRPRPGRRCSSRRRRSTGIRRRRGRSPASAARGSPSSAASWPS